MKPAVQALQRFNKLVSVHIMEATENPKLTYNINVAAFQTVIIYKFGIEVARSTGYLTSKELNDKLSIFK